jgi:glycosyltransferase involved in cell wall biosynthesis
MSNQQDNWVLQIAHSYYPPFLDCTRQYAVLFKGTTYKVMTIYLTGVENNVVKQGSVSDEVVFLGYTSKEVGGLKLGAIAKIRELVKSRSFSFCIAHRVKPTYVALLSTKLPVISVHHNYNDYSRWVRRCFINYFKDRILMLGVSNSVRDDLRRDLKGWDPEKIQTFYNRIDIESPQTQMLHRSEARIKLQLPVNAYVVGNVGRLHHDKDQATLIRGFAKALPSLPHDSLLVIAGSGPLERSLKDLVCDLNITPSIKFLGQVDEMKRLFKAFDVFVLSSDHEPFGMVLLEAMVAELPIICSDCGGGAEVVGDVATLFKLGDPNDLAVAIVETAKLRAGSVRYKSLFTKFSDEAGKRKFWDFLFPKLKN